MKYKIAISIGQYSKKMQNGDAIGYGKFLWADFNDEFQNVELPAIELSSAIYNGHAFTAWHDGRRKFDNFLCAQHIGIDCDYNGIDDMMQNTFVLAYAAVLYATPSSTEENPRCRILFLLDEPIESAEGYEQAIELVISQVPEADRACSDASRFFWGSLNCNMRVPAKTLRVSTLRKLYKDNKSAIEQERSRMQSGVVGDADYNRVIDALNKTDPYSVDYAKWIGIIKAMKREFGDAALRDTVAWARGKPGEVEAEFDRDDKEPRRPMTVATIFKLAQGGSL